MEEEGRLCVVTGCMRCPNLQKLRTPRAACAEDLRCLAVPTEDPDDIAYYGSAMAVGRLISSYIEWPSQLPKDGHFPAWCPLPKITKKKGG